jgi:VanZ family protein
METKLYRYIFWAGYMAVLIMTFIPLTGSLNKIKIGPEIFRIRLDHLLHFVVYLLICLYYLAGHLKGLKLFTLNPLMKFFLLILLLATVTEVAQLWVPRRSFNIFDWVANISGVVVGLGVIKITERQEKVKK